MTGDLSDFHGSTGHTRLNEKFYKNQTIVFIDLLAILKTNVDRTIFHYNL